jgi:murein DD-endopeptidase MepM/ murein hydrolase activator NlpD
MPRPLHLGLLIALAPLLLSAWAQVLPDGVTATPYVCQTPAGAEPPPPPTNDAERLERERRAAYREVFPAYIAAMPAGIDDALPMPVDGVRVAQVADTWGAARSEGRRHEGQDIFAPEGTPIRSATAGHVYRVGEGRLGGNVVLVVGGGGRRYYYAHLSGFADIREGQWVAVGDLLGFVGNTGNAVTTPPHLHFGVYDGDLATCEWEAINPYDLLIDRP